MNGVMLTEEALKVVASNIETYYKKKAPNGAWCISTVQNAAEQFAAMREEISTLKAENMQLVTELNAIVEDLEGIIQGNEPCGYCKRNPCHNPASCPSRKYNGFEWRGLEDTTCD